MPATLPCPKIPNTPAKNGCSHAVPLDVLRGEEQHQRLGHGEPLGLVAPAHRATPAGATSGTRGSRGMATQVRRIQA